jgi:hypothetical protein
VIQSGFVTASTPTTNAMVTGLMELHHRGKFIDAPTTNMPDAGAIVPPLVANDRCQTPNICIPPTADWISNIDPKWVHTFVAQTLWTRLSQSDNVPGSLGDERSVEMSIRTTGILVGAALAIAVSSSMMVRADDKDQPSKDWTVHFGQPQPQTPDPAPVGAAVTHFLMPNDIKINKGDTVTFVVNGGGHGIAIHPVSKNTTRQDIAQDLCAGATPENPDPIVDRRTRNAVCNGTIVTGVGAIVGTQNLNYDITDGKGNLIIHTGVNSPTVANPRVDDPAHSERLLATSGRAPAGDTTGPAANPAGALLTGSAPPATPGNRIQVRFLKTGRFLVICMNRAHSLNDHMFGFVSVVDPDDDN